MKMTVTPTIYTGCDGAPSPYTCDECGALAVTEVQCGWDAARNSGQYQPLCKACYGLTDEAKHYKRQGAILAACKRLGVETRCGPIVLEVGAYGRHPRADDILAEM